MMDEEKTNNCNTTLDTGKSQHRDNHGTGDTPVPLYRKVSPQRHKILSSGDDDRWDDRASDHSARQDTPPPPCGAVTNLISDSRIPPMNLKHADQ